MSTTATWNGQTGRLAALGACLKPGRLIELKEVHCTRDAYGPIMLLWCWAKGYHEPLYLVSTMATAEEAGRLYQKRFHIETFFSDQKSRGFHIHTDIGSSPLNRGLRHEVARLIVWPVVRTRPAVPSAVSYEGRQQGHTLSNALGHSTHSHPTGTKTVRERCLYSHQAEMGLAGWDGERMCTLDTRREK